MFNNIFALLSVLSLNRLNAVQKKIGKKQNTHSIFHQWMTLVIENKNRKQNKGNYIKRN